MINDRIPYYKTFECPKCGSKDFTIKLGCIYTEDHKKKEHLDITCQVCGNDFKKPTKEQVEEDKLIEPIKGWEQTGTSNTTITFADDVTSPTKESLYKLLVKEGYLKE